MINHRTATAQVIDECWRIATLARALADAADRQFMAPTEDLDFDQAGGWDYANGMRALRIQIERVAQQTQGIDAALDRAFFEYHMEVLRADPKADTPPLLDQQIN